MLSYHTCQTISTKARPEQSGRNVKAVASGTRGERDADCECGGCQVHAFHKAILYLYIVMHVPCMSDITKEMPPIHSREA